MAIAPNDQNFDVIVIGGGPAGSSAAYTARQQGLSVAVIDKKTFPRDKLCGALFSSRSRDYYTEIFCRQLDPELFGPKNEIELGVQFVVRGELSVSDSSQALPKDPSWESIEGDCSSSSRTYCPPLRRAVRAGAVGRSPWRSRAVPRRGPRRASTAAGSSGGRGA